MKPTRPEWFQRAELNAFKRDAYAFVKGLSKKESIELAEYLDFRYHEKNTTLVDDEVYDILIFNIEDKWPTAKYLKKVGHKIVTKGRKEVQLPVPMSSLDKIKPDSKNVNDFLASVGMMSDKLDGISLQIEYENGVPKQCFTRGDGTRGQDVSGVIPALRIPKTIPVKQKVNVRCEFVIKGKSFDSKHSKATGKGEYKTARNMGGGLLTRNEPSSAVSDFDVVAFEIGQGKGAGSKPSQQFALLKQWGFTVVRHKRIGGLDAEQAMEWLNKFRKTAKYAIDGVVMAKDVAYKISKQNPKHSKAFKVNSLAASKLVKIVDVLWRRSRYGKMVPRVEVAPVELGGVTVSFFTGHNYYYIQNGFRYQDRNKKMPVRPLGKGAEIRVIRSGDVIPYIMEVVKPARKPSQPDVEFTLDNNGVHAMSVQEKGAKDPELQKKRILQFFSAMKMKGVKSGIIEKLYDSGFKTLRSILQASPQKLTQAEGVKEKTAQNVVATIQEGLAQATFARTGYASSIFGDKIGTRKLQAVIEAYPNIMELSESLSPLQLQDMLEDVAGIKTQAVMLSKGLPKFAKFLTRNKIQLVGDVAQVKTGNKLDGVKVLFTSVRDEDLLNDILTNGGLNASSVKSATHLVAKPGASNKKTDLANDMGIPVMTVEEFRAKFRL